MGIAPRAVSALLVLATATATLAQKVASGTSIQVAQVAGQSRGTFHASHRRASRRTRGEPRPLPEWLAAKIAAISIREGVDHMLVLEMMRQESGFYPGARSPKGAEGLMQFIPSTARRFGVDAKDPDGAIVGACKYIRYLAQRFNSVPLILAAYNAGEGAVERYGNRVPPFQETQAYVRAIMAGYNRAKEIQSAIAGPEARGSVSARLGSWASHPASREEIRQVTRIPNLGSGAVHSAAPDRLIPTKE